MPDMTAPAPSRGPARGPAMGTPPPLATFGLDVLDDLRRSAGRLLDTLGHAPRTTPSAVVDLAPGVRLHTYPDADPSGPPVLLVPAPIKRCYIFDLDPRCSVVARCLRHGLQPHLVEWTDPEPDQQRLGLDHYADGLLRHCLRAVADRTRVGRVPLVGHSLGGTLAALCAARYPDLVAGVALLEAPLYFGSHTGRLEPLITTPTPGPTIGLLDAFPNGVPGSLLTLAAAAAAPPQFHLHPRPPPPGCPPPPVPPRPLDRPPRLPPRPRSPGHLPAGAALDPRRVPPTPTTVPRRRRAALPTRRVLHRHPHPRRANPRTRRPHRADAHRGQPPQPDRATVGGPDRPPRRRHHRQTDPAIPGRHRRGHPAPWRPR